MQRRKFLQAAGLSATALVAQPLLAKESKKSTKRSDAIKPLTICTWNFHRATAKSWEVISNGGTALDAVEQGVMVEESDLSNQTVGKGGRPDRDGEVTLDACIMDAEGNCGSVVYLQNIAHPINVARKVMEETPHVMLAGKGAEQFAYEMGFKKDNLLTPVMEKERNKILNQYSDFSFDEALDEVKSSLKTEKNTATRLVLLAVKSWIIKNKVHVLVNEPFTFSLGEMEGTNVFTANDDEDPDDTVDGLFDDDNDDASDDVEIVITKTTSLNGDKLLKNAVLEVGKDDAKKLVSENKAKYTSDA